MSEQSFPGDHVPSVADSGFNNSPDITLPLGTMFSKCRWEDSSETAGRDCMKPLRPSVSANIPSGSRSPSSLFKTRAHEDMRHLDTLPAASRVGTKCAMRRHGSKAWTEASKSAGKQIAAQAFNIPTQHFGNSDTMDHETNFNSQPMPMPWAPNMNLEYEPSDLAPDTVDQAQNFDHEPMDSDRELQWSPRSTPQPKTESIHLHSQASSPWEELGDETSEDISDIHLGLEKDTAPESEHDPTEHDPKSEHGWGDWLTDHPEDIWEDTPWEIEDEASFQDWMDQTRFPQWGPWSYYQEPRNWLDSFSDNFSELEDDPDDPNWERWLADEHVGYWKPGPDDGHRYNYWATWGSEEESAHPAPDANGTEKMMRRAEIMTQYLDIHDQISLVLSRPTKEEWEMEIEGYLRELSERIERMLPQASSSQTQEAHDSSALASSPFVTDVGQSEASNNSGAEGDVGSDNLDAFMRRWKALIGHGDSENQRDTLTAEQEVAGWE